MDETNKETGSNNDEVPAGRPGVGIVIIILVVLLGGLYFWKTKIETGGRTNPANQAE